MTRWSIISKAKVTNYLAMTMEMSQKPGSYRYFEDPKYLNEQMQSSSTKSVTSNFAFGLELKL